MKLGKRNKVLVSFMLFSLFFGAGNLIFPPFLGQNAGSATLPAMLGFLLTAVVLPVRGSHLTVAGVTDNVAGRFGLPGPDPHRALEGTPRPRILMAHKPELFHETAPEIDLQLSGHTHGGLALLLDQGVALFNGGFVRGWYARDDARLYVGPGSGLWGGFPLRLGMPSEILLLVLRAPR